MMEYAPAATAAIFADEEELAARIGALVGSRLCHDLVSPLGAIGNGVELLQMSGDWPGLESSPEMSLIGDALRAARGRIACFRVAFGAAGETQRLSQGEIAALIADLEQSGRMKIALQNEGDQARSTVKMLILSLMCLQTAMPWGARVSIRQQGREWQIEAAAERTRQAPELWSWLNFGPDARPEPPAAEVHFPLLGLAARQHGRQIRWSISDTGGSIIF